VRGHNTNLAVAGTGVDELAGPVVLASPLRSTRKPVVVTVLTVVAESDAWKGPPPPPAEHAPGEGQVSCLLRS
jgi:hypothetical protein